LERSGDIIVKEYRTQSYGLLTEKTGDRRKFQERRTLNIKRSTLNKELAFGRGIALIKRQQRKIKKSKYKNIKYK
jgi:hypothetical protein